MLNQKALFLDRDGVINIEKNYLHKIEDFEFIKGVFKKTKEFYDNGYLIFVITNQSGIGRGYYTENDFLKLNSWMEDKFLKEGIKISKVYYCPHAPEQNCECRKPKAGMINNAKKEFNLDIENSILIGDKEIDIEAGMAAGIKNNILVRTGHKIDETKSKATMILDSMENIKLD